MPISPNSLTMTAYFLPCGSDRMRFKQRGLAGAEIAGEHGDGDFGGGGFSGGHWAVGLREEEI